MTWDQIQQLIRIIAYYGSGFLMSWGLITADMQTALVSAVVTVCGVAWWALWERNRAGSTPPQL